ncbi:MAG: hypothetical protein ACK56F_20890, partial [bacterium]
MCPILCGTAILTIESCDCLEKSPQPIQQIRSSCRRRIFLRFVQGVSQRRAAPRIPLAEASARGGEKS